MAAPLRMNEWEAKSTRAAAHPDWLEIQPLHLSLPCLKQQLGTFIVIFLPCVSSSHSYQATAEQFQTQFFCFHALVLYWLLQAWLPNTRTEQWRITQMYLCTVFFQSRTSFCAPRTVPLQLVGQWGDGVSGSEGTPGLPDVLHGSCESGCNISKTVNQHTMAKLHSNLPKCS